MGSDSRTCGSCGQANSDTAASCENCGQPLGSPDSPQPKRPWYRDIIQPFIDLVHAPRALWGVNLPYFVEGIAYWGVLGYLLIYFSGYVFSGVETPDVHASRMVMVLTAGITISMFCLGFVPDKWGVRRAILIAFVLMIIGRVLIAGGPAFGFEPAGLWSALHWVTLVGLVFVVVGYGMYQPAAYAAVRQFTTPKTAAMGFAMLYALMNLGGFIPSFAGFLRHAVGINGVFWVYAGFTVVALLVTAVILTRRTVADAIATANDAKEQLQKKEEDPEKRAEADDEPQEKPERRGGLWNGIVDWVTHHPFTDAKFTFFIFCLIPVQTLFAYNWLILPPYVERAFRGSLLGDYFEFAVNFNPLLIFILVPIVTALTQRRKVYNMMIVGTFVMAAPAFLLALGTSSILLFSYLLIMTVGEAMWQPRFLQYAAEIAPEGRTGVYMGVAQLPWFLTKVIAPLYTGYFLTWFCPAEGELRTGIMWFIFACIAMCSTVMLLLAKGWIGKDFKTKA